MMRLAELVKRLGGDLSAPARELEVREVQVDSRAVRSGDLFAALPGSVQDGAQFLPDAISRGAVSVLTAAGVSLPEGPSPGLEVLQWIHPEARRTAGRAAALVQGAPANCLNVVGITGTNGKTTVAHLLGQILDQAGLSPAVLGTAGHRLAGRHWVTATHTTPDAPALQRLLAQHAAAGGRTVAMEVSSHALDQERVAGVDFSVAVFTNLTREHLDYHRDMRSYLEAKSRLFETLVPGSAAVLNRDDPAWRELAAVARHAGARVMTYSVRQAADLTATGLRSDSAGSRFTIDGMGIFSTELRFPLRGRYNVENALAAAAAARLLGVSPSATVEGLATSRAAPGRLEQITTGDRGFEVFVDYAHSPDSLERALLALREDLTARAPTVAGRLLVVFGCGGDRDQGKRADMGRAASKHADIALLTSDNPRSESPQAIIDHILVGTGGMAGAEVIVEPDRRRAIELAVTLARPGDVVLIAGKGHETEQLVGDQILPFDDRVVAQEALAQVTHQQETSA